MLFCLWNTIRNAPGVQSAQERTPVCQVQLREAKLHQRGQREPEAPFHQGSEAVPPLREREPHGSHACTHTERRTGNTPPWQTCGSFLSAALVYISAAVRGSLLPPFRRSPIRIRAGGQRRPFSLRKDSHSGGSRRVISTVSVGVLALDGQVIVSPHAAGRRVLVQESSLERQGTGYEAPRGFKEAAGSGSPRVVRTGRPR